jgi:hypothetical protein
MTELTEKLYNTLVEHYGDRLANPDVFPETFKYQVRMFFYAAEQEKKETENEQNVDHK